MGIGEVGLLWLAVPTLCNSWFNKGAGTIIGLSMAFTGIGGACWLQVFNGCYAQRISLGDLYIIWGIIALVTSLPFTLFCIRKTLERSDAFPTARPLPSPVCRGHLLCLRLSSPCFLRSVLVRWFDQCFDDGRSAVPDLHQAARRSALRRSGRWRYDGDCHDGCSGCLQGFAWRRCRQQREGFFVAAVVTGIGGVLLGNWFLHRNEIILVYAGAAIYGFFFAACMVLTPCVARKLFGTGDTADLRIHFHVR